MSRIRIKRGYASPTGTANLLAGELGLAQSNLFYAPALPGNFGADGSATPSLVEVATRNNDNTFTATNTFSGAIGFLNGYEHHTTYGLIYTGGTLYDSAQQLVNKAYVDARVQGLTIKTEVKAATTANIDLTTGGLLIIDTYQTVALDRILVKNQSVPAQNGIYTVNAGAWTRTTDADTWGELVDAYVFVMYGSQQDTGWTCTILDGGTLNTTDVTWAQFSMAGQVSAGAGLDKVGNTILMGQPGSLNSATTNLASGTTHTHAITNYSLAGTTNQINLSGASKVLGAAGTFSLSSTLITPGTLQTTGELTVGTNGGSWSIDGGGTNMVFTKGSYTATLIAPSSNKTIAYTTDLPAGVDVITCATAAATVQKDVTVTNYTEADGKQLYIDFTYENTATSPTLSVNAGTARAIYINDVAAASGSWAAGNVLRLAYDATTLRYNILENLTTKQYYGNAATATKLGTSTVGSTTLPIYLNAGTPTALTQANLRIGVFGTSAIGSTTLPVYIEANGVPTALTQANLRIGLFGSAAIGSASQPIYINTNGVATAITGTIGNSTTGNAATASAVATAAEETGITARYIMFAAATSGNQALKADSDLTYIPTSGILTAIQFEGLIDGGTTWA